MVKDGDIFGDGVNVAARLEGLEHRAPIRAFRLRIGEAPSQQEIPAPRKPPSHPN
jgi:hypothetical protein